MKNKNKLSISAQILIGMSTGLAFGLLARAAGWTDFQFFQTYITDGLLHVVGQIFIRSLQMLVVPLVFISLVCGTSQLSEPSKLGRLGGKTLGLYLMTTAIAVTVAMFMAVLLEPGSTVVFSSSSFAPKAAPPISDTFIDLVPKNPISAMADGNMLQIIVFALLFGIAMALTGKKSAPVQQLFQGLNEVVMKLVTLLMHVAPYGVFALLAGLTIRTGTEAFGNLANYFLLVLGLLLVHGLLVYPVLLKLFTGLNPWPFLLKMRPVHLFAISTASSNATLPVTLEVVTKRIGVKSTTASFTLPLGATINMDGTAIMQGVATVFIAQIYGADLSTAQYLTVIVTATLASIGAAGVPGVGLITLAMVLQQVNLPTEGIGIILGIDRILDMVRTAVNVTGDAVVTVIVGRSEGELDEATYHDPNAGEDFEEVEFEKTTGPEV
jgi:Na+/H+-dicarboxylate symporter